VVGNKLQSKPLLRVVTDDTLRAEPLLIEAATDRHPWWRRAVAILAALLLHLAAVATLIDKAPPEAPPQPAPIPVELAYEPPKPPAAAEQKPPAQQQPLPDRRSGGDIENVPQGPPPASTKAETPPAAEPPTAQPAAPVAETPPPATMPPLPYLASPQSESVPPPATQQAMIAPPLPRTKPPAPAARKTTVAAPAEPQTATKSPDTNLESGPGGGDKYLNAMRDEILRHLVYPPTAELFRISGVAFYEIAITRKGELLDVRLAKSSGYAMLDNAGLQTIRMSAPFDPVPDDIPGHTIGLTLRLSMGPER